MSFAFYPKHMAFIFLEVNFMDKLYRKYNGYQIEDMGAYKSNDFVSFARYMKRRMKAAAEEKGIQLENFTVGHYFVSGFFHKGDKWAYFSFDDCRYKPINFDTCGVNGFLLRTAEGPKDYHGGHNNFTNLNGFMPLLEKLLS